MNNSTILAKKYLDNHRNPIKKFELPGHKLFIPAVTEEEAELVARGLDVIKCSFEHERVERRCARSVASWLHDVRLAKLAKGSKIRSTYGFANRNGRFLYPEEALLFMEQNHLELFVNNIPISIEEAYRMLITSKTELYKYLAYRKLQLQGFRTVRSGCLPTKLESLSPKKRRLEKEPRKKHPNVNSNNEDMKLPSKLDEVSTGSANLHETQPATQIETIFDKLRMKGPKQCATITLPEQSDYQIFCPDNVSGLAHDFNLHISEVKHFDPKIGFSNMSTPTIVNYASSEFSGYFQISKINLPTLL